MQQVCCIAAREVYYVHHGFDRSKCLADEGKNPLVALSHIEFVDSTSHKVNRLELHAHSFCSPRLLWAFNEACTKLGTTCRLETKLQNPIWSRP